MDSTILMQSDQAVKAIIVFRGQLLMQLRDNKNDIYYPGSWGFFGGDIEQGETPESALKRELLEELALEEFSMRKIFEWKNPSTTTLIHYFLIFLENNPDNLCLQEGQAKELFFLEELRELKVTPDFPILEDTLKAISHLENT